MITRQMATKASNGITRLKTFSSFVGSLMLLEFSRNTQSWQCCQLCITL